MTDWYILVVVVVVSGVGTVVVVETGVSFFCEIKVNVFETEGYAVTVEVEGDVKEYAESFLHIFNNVRASEKLLKIKNY